MRASVPTLALAAVLALAACGGSSGTAETPATTIAPPTDTAGPAAVTATAEGLPFAATLDAPTATPAATERWDYVVEVTDPSGSPIEATVTVEIVDPLQQAHPVDYDATTEPIVDRPIEGEFRDYVEWTADSRGVPLTFRVTVTAAGATAELTYPVTPK